MLAQIHNLISVRGPEYFVYWKNKKHKNNSTRTITHVCINGVARPRIWGAKKFGGAKMSDFRRITLFCSEKRLSKYKMTICSKNFWGDMALLGPPWIRLWFAYRYCYLFYLLRNMFAMWLMKVILLLHNSCSIWFHACLMLQYGECRAYVHLKFCFDTWI